MLKFMAAAHPRASVGDDVFACVNTNRSIGDGSTVTHGGSTNDDLSTVIF